MKLKMLNLNNGEISEYKTDLKEKELNPRILYLVDRNQKDSLRSGTAKVKTRGEVRGGGSKPYRQKGTGRARRGTSSSPLIEGGGVIFGPQVRDYSWKINSKLVNNAIIQILTNSRDKIMVLSGYGDKEIIKTKKVIGYLGDKASLKQTLIVAPNERNLERSFANIRKCKVVDVNFIPISTVLNSDSVLITENAIKSLEERFRGWN